jgi:hypothetical protein
MIGVAIAFLAPWIIALVGAIWIMKRSNEHLVRWIVLSERDANAGAEGALIRDGFLKLNPLLSRQLFESNQAPRRISQQTAASMKIMRFVLFLFLAVCVGPVPRANAEAKLIGNCYVGTYRFADGSVIDIARSEGDTLRWRKFDGTTGALHKKAERLMAEHAWLD